MGDVTRRIGLSLGADLCWPWCFEEILDRLDLALPVDGQTVRFSVERVTIEPVHLREKIPYDLVLDRLTHWYPTRREWIKKGIITDGIYVLNNPWSLQSMEKHTTYCAMANLGLPVPDTCLLPPKEYEPSPDLRPTLERYARLFDLPAIGEQMGYPLFLKPYDGGAWVGVDRIDDREQLMSAYDRSRTRLMLLQEAVVPFDLFVRCVGIGPQVRVIKYDPGEPMHDRYRVDRGFLDDEEESLLRDMTLTINTFFGWDFNSCEALRRDGVFHPIDFANACPDTQVTSLHYHFPWFVKALLRWTIFCAATRRKMRPTLDWEPYFQIRERDLPYRERLAAYAEVARERLDAGRFEEFCDRHLPHLDEVVWEFFAAPEARDTVRAKVAALYPEDEVDDFTERFWGRIQQWRQRQPQASAAVSAS